MAREGSAVCSFPTKASFSTNFLLRILSCVIATIRDSVFFIFSCDRFSLYLLLFCFFVPFRQNGRLFCISEKYSLFDRNFKNENSRVFLLSFAVLFFVTKAFSRLFLSRRKVALCQSGRMAQKLKHNKLMNSGKKSSPIAKLTDTSKGVLSLDKIIKGEAVE